MVSRPFCTQKDKEPERVDMMVYLGEMILTCC